MPRIVLVGAASAQFGYPMLGDVFSSEALRGSTLVLCDIQPAALERVAGAARDFIARHKLDFALQATCERREALRGADFVIISIEVGDRFALWDIDWKLPLQFGIRQVYGENGGPGGLLHSLRVIPPVLEICADIERLCPRALVFNLTNPMTRVCLAVARSFPGLRFLGLCHEVNNFGRHLPRLTGLPLGEMVFRAGGLNHFNMLLEVRDRRGRDLYPQVLRAARELFEKEPGDASHLLAGMGVPPGPPRPWEERGLWRIFLDEYGLLPASTDAHLGEFIGWAASLVDHQGIAEFFQAYRRFCREQRPELTLSRSEERVVPIIEAVLAGGGEEERAVNLPNLDLLDDLPRDMVVEVPAAVDGRGVHGISLGRLPAGFAALLKIQAAVADLAVEAVRQGSLALARQALLADPLLGDARAAEPLLGAAVELERPYLDYLR